MKEIEKGKAIIGLAQLFMILAGFLFATGGIFYTNSISNLSTSLSIAHSQIFEMIQIGKTGLSFDEKAAISDLIETDRYYMELIEPQQNLAYGFFLLGFVSVIAS
ncbi:MAG: hypothetical protein KC506_03545, partial [Nanoarchaeota archaeon]|nr:hypothetical protein [Nanoarchaeota archaeon]